MSRNMPLSDSPGWGASVRMRDRIPAEGAPARTWGMGTWKEFLCAHVVSSHYPLGWTSSSLFSASLSWWCECRGRSRYRGPKKIRWPANYVAGQDPRTSGGLVCAKMRGSRDSLPDCRDSQLCPQSQLRPPRVFPRPAPEYSRRSSTSVYDLCPPSIDGVQPSAVAS